MVKITDLNTKHMPTWCPGCGDFLILSSLKGAIVEMNLDPKDVLIVSGIGCSSELPHWIKTYGFHTLHGRALPAASGARLANTDVNIFVIMGDGDCYSIGMGHFIHALRRNLNMTAIVHDNRTYGLTKGQYSPTSHKGTISVTTPDGSIEEEVNPLALAITMGCSFVARASAADPAQLKKLIIEANNHKGFALIDIFQMCPTYNKENDLAYYKSRTYDLAETDHDVTNAEAAWKKSFEYGEKIPTGVFYKVGYKGLYEESLPAIKDKPLYKQDISNIDVSKIMERME